MKRYKCDFGEVEAIQLLDTPESFSEIVNFLKGKYAFKVIDNEIHIRKEYCRYLYEILRVGDYLVYKKEPKLIQAFSSKYFFENFVEIVDESEYDIEGFKRMVDSLSKKFNVTPKDIRINTDEDRVYINVRHNLPVSYTSINQVLSYDVLKDEEKESERKENEM